MSLLPLKCTVINRIQQSQIRMQKVSVVTHREEGGNRKDLWQNNDTNERTSCKNTQRDAFERERMNVPVRQIFRHQARATLQQT